MLVPLSAVQRRGDEIYVMALGSGNKVAKRPVKVEFQNDKQAVVTDGLTSATSTLPFARAAVS